MSITIGVAGTTNGSNQTIVPLVGSGALGANYLMLLSPTSANGILRGSLSYCIHGTACGALPDLNEFNEVSIHLFAMQNVTAPANAAAVATFAGTVQDLLPGIAAKTNYYYLETFHAVLLGHKQPFVQASTGAAFQGDISTALSGSLAASCLREQPASQRKGIVAVVVARSYVGEVPVQPLVIDWVWETRAAA